MNAPAKLNAKESVVTLAESYLARLQGGESALLLDLDADNMKLQGMAFDDPERPALRKRRDDVVAELKDQREQIVVAKEALQTARQEAADRVVAEDRAQRDADRAKGRAEDLAISNVARQFLRAFAARVGARQASAYRANLKRPATFNPRETPSPILYGTLLSMLTPGLNECQAVLNLADKVRAETRHAVDEPGLVRRLGTLANDLQQAQAELDADAAKRKAAKDSRSTPPHPQIREDLTTDLEGVKKEIASTKKRIADLPELDAARIRRIERTEAAVAALAENPETP